MSPMSDARAAFLRLYEETRREVLVYLTARCGDPADVADLFQETYAEVYAALCRRGPAYVRRGEAFVKKLAAQQLHRHYARRRPRRDVALEFLAAPPRRPARPRLLPVTASAAAVAAALLLAVLPQRTPAGPTAPPAQIQAADAPRTPEPAEEPDPEPVPPDELHIHDLEDAPLAAAPDFALSQLLLEHAQYRTLAEFLDGWGWNPLPGRIPAGLSPAFDADSTWVYAVDPETGEVWDQASFLWREWPDGYDPLERTVTVVAASREILSCGILVPDAAMEPSTVGGVSMTLGRRETPYGPYTDGPDGEKTPAGYRPVWEADFQLRGLHLQVTAENLTEAEFLDVLRSMVD